MVEADFALLDLLWKYTGLKAEKVLSPIRKWNRMLLNLEWKKGVLIIFWVLLRKRLHINFDHLFTGEI